MINFDLIETLFNELPPNQKNQLTLLLFGTAHPTIERFREQRIIKYSQLETLADFFHMPIKHFRKDTWDDKNHILIARIDDINYKIDTINKTAEVYEDDGEEFYDWKTGDHYWGYKGDVSIQSSFFLDNDLFIVNGIGFEAFRAYGEFSQGHLTSVTIPCTVMDIGNSAFFQCNKLTDIVIPHRVRRIGDWAFYGCHSLKSITLSDGLIDIGDSAFFHCHHLTTINIPGSVKRIGNGAFHECLHLTSISVEPENTVYDSRDNSNAIIETATNTLIVGCRNTIIPNSVTSIGVGAFHSRHYMHYITIPESVTCISEHAFHGCKDLTSVIILGKKVKIMENAFDECNKLKSITFYGDELFIGDLAFRECTSITDIHMKSVNPDNIHFMRDLEDEVYENSILYIPEDTVDKYRTHPVFGKFKNIRTENDKT